jgi:integrase
MSIWIETKGTALRLRWRHDGKRYCIGLGVHDNPTGRAFANQKKSQIEMDILSGHFDVTLLKYRPRKLGIKHTEVTAVELFEKYAANRFRDRGLSNSSQVRLKGIASKLNQYLGDKNAEKVTSSVAKSVVARWSETVSSRTIKERLFDLKACWEWSEGKYHTAEANPWAECLDLVQAKGNSGQTRQQKKVFTINELQTIIAAFAASSYYSHYTEFVIFLASTACRFGEVVALRWKHLDPDFSTAWIGESISRGHQNQKGTKTGNHRTIQLTPTVRSMLVARSERLNPQPDDLVFPSPTGIAIDDHRFRARAWKTTLESCQIDYQTPYQVRHAAISHALAAGANPVDLAKQTGHSYRVLMSTYAHVVDRECLFVDIGR